MTVGELDHRMSSAEYAEWLAFMTTEPVGDMRGDLQAAVVAATVANCHRGKNRRPFRPADFMPKFDKTEKQPKQVSRDLRGFLAKFKGK